MTEQFDEKHIETRHKDKSGLECPECKEKRMSAHPLTGDMYCWAECGWITGKHAKQKLKR